VDVFEDCLAKGRLKPLEVDVEKIAKELATARDELTRGRACYVGGNWAEASTQAYFALYRSARAALNSQGYRDTNLYGLCVGLRRLFVETGKFEKEVVDQIREAKDIKDLVYESGRSSRRDAPPAAATVRKATRNPQTKSSLVAPSSLIGSSRGCRPASRAKMDSRITPGS